MRPCPQADRRGLEALSPLGGCLVPVGTVGVGGPAYELGLLDGDEALAALNGLGGG